MRTHRWTRETTENGGYKRHQHPIDIPKIPSITHVRGYAKICVDCLESHCVFCKRMSTYKCPGPKKEEESNG